jgi:hypothetical protein
MSVIDKIERLAQVAIEENMSPNCVVMSSYDYNKMLAEFGGTKDIKYIYSSAGRLRVLISNNIVWNIQVVDNPIFTMLEKLKVFE